MSLPLVRGRCGTDWGELESPGWGGKNISPTMLPGKATWSCGGDDEDIFPPGDRRSGRNLRGGRGIRHRPVPPHRHGNRPPPVSVGVRLDSSLLDIEFDVTGFDREELARVLASYRLHRRYHRLRSGTLPPPGRQRAGRPHPDGG